MRGRVGEVELVCLPEAQLPIPLRTMVSPEELGHRPYEEMLSGEYYDAATGNTRMPVNVWLLRVGGRTILIDSGTGDLPREGMAELFDDWPTTHSPLLENLAAEGLAPEDVDLVLCTHLHLDHVGGHTRSVDGALVPTFPNARYLISRAEYEHAAAEAALEGTPRLLKQVFNVSVQPLIDAGAAVLLDGSHEIDQSITMVPALGHTPGHMRIEIRSVGEFAIHCGDIIHFPYEIDEPEIPCAVADYDTAHAVQTRKRLLADCAEHDALLITIHLHDPGVGRISRRNGRFAYEPGWTS